MTANHRPLEEGDIKLIDCVHATPCLYDTKDPNFRLIYKKEQEWQSIAENLDMSDLEARKRWTVLRDRYSRELKQLIQHPDSKEYGKNDFFRRMDFLRKFVKKREAKRKRNNFPNVYIKEETNPRPLKLYKVKYNNSDTDDNQVSQQLKPYITDESQYSSNGNVSYDEQLSQEPICQEERHENVNSIDQQYQEYEEDASVTYEVVAEDNDSLMLESTANSGRKKTVKEEKISLLPQLQHRPIVTSVCTQAAPHSSPVDMEEYFSKTIALYLRRLAPRYKIKAKVEIMQIIEKYIDLQESKS